MSNRIYLDNAATSWPKPDAVYQAIDRYQRENGSPYGRGTSQFATEVARTLKKTRRGIGQLIGCNEPNRIVFTSSGTDGLNLALHGLLHPNDHVVTTQAEHNSVLRPLKSLESVGVHTTRVPVDASGFVDPAAMEKSIRKETRLMVVIHASNVTGAIQPIREIGEICRTRGVFLLIDAAQTLGHLPISLGDTHFDLLAAPGHKGLLGPTGTGILYVGDRIEREMRAVRQGGTGTQSELDEQPETLPEKFESGNHNVPGIVGLAAGIEFLLQNFSKHRSVEKELGVMLHTALSEIAGVTLYSPEDHRVPVISFNISGFEPQEASLLLESTAGIECRAGFHCAPRIHHAIDSMKLGGTIRASIGPFNTKNDIDQLLHAVQDLSVG